MSEMDIYSSFLRTCARLAKGGVKVEVMVFSVGHASINRIEADRIGIFNYEYRDYRDLPREWVRPVDDLLVALVRQGLRTGGREQEVFLNRDGVWCDEGCAKPLFRPLRSAGAKKPTTRRHLAIEELGEAVVIEAEGVVAHTVERLLASPALKKAGFRAKGMPKMAFRWNHGLSYGGRSGLRFALLGHARKPEKNATFKEYVRLNDFPDIGDFTGTRIDCYRVLAAHELAHWLQYAPEVRRPDGHFKPPHGEGFRVIYRILRQELSAMDGVSLKGGADGV